MLKLALNLIVECNMLDKLANLVKLGFMSTFVIKNLTHFFIAISKVMVIHLVKIVIQLVEKK